MKFQSRLITNILNNQSSCIENVIRSIDPSERVVIAQGYGVDLQVPRRFLAYAVPVLRLASQLSEMTIVEFYFATHGVFRANGVFYTESLSRTREELSWFIQTYYPRLSSRVRIMEDAPLSTESMRVIETLLTPARRVAENNPHINQFLANRGGESALRYMLEHLLYMRDPILVDNQPNRELLVPEMATDRSHVIMIGGPAEKIFSQFRQAMLKECGVHAEWKSYQFFTPVGDPPTYHVYPGEPVIGQGETSKDLFSYLKKLPGDMGKQRNLVRDYSVLLQEFAGVEIFKLPHETNPETIKKGEDVLNRRYS